MRWDTFWWPQSGHGYAFWSSFGGCLTYFAGFAVVYRRMKCKSCWRLAHHKVEGTHYRTCHIHATQSKHDALRARHKAKHPDTHAFLNRETPRSER